MSGPIKDNAHVRADHPAFLAAYDRARATFRAVDGVVDVAFGQKQTGGAYRDDIAIVVFVRVKRPTDEVAPDELIPETFEGYRTDVRTVRTGRFDACDNTATYETIQGGIQITTRMDSAGRWSTGTLGCLVRRRGDAGRENIYLLSNKHVLRGQGAGVGDYIYHPFPPPHAGFQKPGDANALGPTQEGSVLGNFPHTVPGDQAPTEFFVDAAIARVDIDSKCCGSTCTKDVIETAPGSIIDLAILGKNTIRDVRSVINDPDAIGQRVVKVGRTTGRTVGVIRLINAPVSAPQDPAAPGSGPIEGRNTIEIDFDPSAGEAQNCKGNAKFTEPGDSGAMVVDMLGRVVGLHSLGTGEAGTQPSNACHIAPVLAALQICVACDPGAAHGSCAATDGSGTAPAAPPAAQPEPGGFGDTAVTGGLIPPVTIPDAERERLLALLATFREPERGRDLHDQFGHVRREAGYLVRNCRPVTVVWHRNQGPAFLAHLLNHLRGETATVPLKVNGVPRAQLLDRMADVLTRHGSNPLRAAIERHRAELAPLLARATTVDDAVSLFSAGAGVRP